MLADSGASARVRQSAAVSAARNVAALSTRRAPWNRRQPNERRLEKCILQREIKLTKIRKIFSASFPS
jgi:hypothetical protein